MLEIPRQAHNGYLGSVPKGDHTPIEQSANVRTEHILHENFCSNTKPNVLNSGFNFGMLFGISVLFPPIKNHIHRILLRKIYIE